MNNAKFKQVGERLKKERKTLGMTLEEVGSAIGTTRQSMSKWEKGEGLEISVEMLVRLCTIFDCDMRYLLCEQDCRTKVATDIQEETGLSETATNILKSTPGISKILNLLFDEYDAATIPDATVIGSMIRLFEIPRPILENQTAYISVELLENKKHSHFESSIKEPVDALSYLERVHSENVRERLVQLSRKGYESNNG